MCQTLEGTAFGEAGRDANPGLELRPGAMGSAYAKIIAAINPPPCRDLLPTSGSISAAGHYRVLANMPLPLNFMCAFGVALSTVAVPSLWGAQTPRQPDNRAVRSAPDARQRLVGVWQLATRSVRKDNGEVVIDPVLGQQPLGRLYYDASGGMMLQMMRTGRTAAIGKPAHPEDAANPRAVLGYDAYFGTYTVNEAEGTVTHHVQGSLFPEDLGKEFVRLFTLDGDTLTLSFTSPAAGGSKITRTLTFRRSQ
jgi:hypothetical protein